MTIPPAQSSWRWWPVTLFSIAVCVIAVWGYRRTTGADAIDFDAPPRGTGWEITKWMYRGGFAPLYSRWQSTRAMTPSAAEYDEVPPGTLAAVRHWVDTHGLLLRGGGAATALLIAAAGLLSMPMTRPIGVVLLPIFAASINFMVCSIDGQQAWLDPFSRQSMEYYGDVPAVANSPAAFLRDYTQIIDDRGISHHAMTHPPGGVIFQWWAAQMFGYSLRAGSAAAIGATALGAWPLYGFIRFLAGSRAAAAGAVLWLATPNVVLFGATCMDGVFVLPLLVALCAFAGFVALDRRCLRLPLPVPGERGGERGQALEHPRMDVAERTAGSPSPPPSPRLQGEEVSPSRGRERLASHIFTALIISLLGIVAGLALAAGMLMSFTAVCVGGIFALFNLLLLISACWKTIFVGRAFRPAGAADGAPEGTPYGRAVKSAVVAGRQLWRSFGRALLFNLVAAATFVGVFVVLYKTVGYDLLANIDASRAIDRQAMGDRTSSLWRWFDVGLANMMAFLIGAGVPLAAICLRRLPRSVVEWTFVIALPAIAWSTLYTLEVERIWLFFVPFLILAAVREAVTVPRVAFVVMLLWTQTIVTETVLYTYW